MQITKYNSQCKILFPVFNIYINQVYRYSYILNLEINCKGFLVCNKTKYISYPAFILNEKYKLVSGSSQKTRNFCEQDNLLVDVR